MDTSDGTPAQHAQAPDPWQAVSYMLSGLIVYGLAGYGLDVWLGTSFLVGVGIVIGTGLGVLMVWMRWGRPPADFDPRTGRRRHADDTAETTTEQETQ
ncbi:AtpZ/AtpI family protein [Nocardioidaceae bacterium]|nr:AtpZ/AtpI family protein [Nocardioidaceae bacterium]